MCKFGFTPVDNVCLPTPRAVIDERGGLATNNIQIYPQKAIQSHHSPPKSRPDNTNVKSKTHSRRSQRALPGEFCNKVSSNLIVLSNSLISFSLEFVLANLVVYIHSVSVPMVLETMVSAAY